jgi:hypothetical protein
MSPLSRPPIRKPLLAASFFAAFYVCFFSPALFTGKVLAPPTDAAFFYYPHYNSPLRLWDPLLMTGYPAMADPQMVNWYPLALLLRWIPGSWNVFVVLAYVLASWFMYAFVRKLTGRDFAGLVSGLIFGLCGFMNVHLQHTTIVHTALWIPAILLCVERLAERVQWRWVLLGGLATGTFVLAGHPQITLFGLTLSFAYFVLRGFSAAAPRWRYIVAVALTMGTGLALSAIQTLPAAELAAVSTRATLSFAEFSSYEFPPKQLTMLLFPWLFGGMGPVSYFGAWNLTELAGYVGLSGLALSAIAVVSRRTPQVMFWLTCMAVSLIASMGSATPVGRILYALPGFGQFRAPGRFLLLFGVSASVLAGYGLTAILERQHPRRNFVAAIAACLGLILVATLVARVSLTLVASCCLCAILALLIWRPESMALRTTLVLAVIVELSLFSWFGEWRFLSPAAADLQQPEIVRHLSPAMRIMHARWVPVRGDMGKLAEAPGDLPSMWQLPSLSKYGPLLPARYKDLLDMQQNGEFRGQWWDPANSAFDIASGRFVAVPDVPATSGPIFQGVQFAGQDLPLSVGNQCGADVPAAAISLGRPREIRGIALVTMTGCSYGIPQGSPVVELRLSQPDGESVPLQIRAGVETAEWAAGCADVAPKMRHRAPAIFSRHTVPRGRGACQAQTYAAILTLPEPISVTGLQFRWLRPGFGTLQIDKISLLDAKTGNSQMLSEQDVRFGDSTRWRRFDQAGGVAVYENLRAQPRAWLVPETVTAPQEQIVRTIQTSRLPDGRAFNPAVVALIEETSDFRGAPQDPNARVEFMEDTAGTVEIRAVSTQPAFLVLGDFYYPGWRATLDGQPAHIFRTNSVQRGVSLPAGNHVVRFEYRPVRFYAGAGVSLSTLALLAGAALFARKRGLL